MSYLASGQHGHMFGLLALCRSACAICLALPEMHAPHMGMVHAEHAWHAQSVQLHLHA